MAALGTLDFWDAVAVGRLLPHGEVTAPVHGRATFDGLSPLGSLVLSAERLGHLVPLGTRPVVPGHR